MGCHRANSVRFDRCRAKLAETRARFGRCRAQLGRFRAKFGRTRPTLGRLWRLGLLAKTIARGNLGKNWANSSRNGSNSVEMSWMWSIRRQVWPKSGHLENKYKLTVAESTKFNTTSAGLPVDESVASTTYARVGQQVLLWRGAEAETKYPQAA